MLSIRENPTPREIYDAITRHKIGDVKTKTYIITGKVGPTGKTWLWNELRRSGHKAIEITEQLGPFVTYNDDRNHCVEVGLGNAVLIILNKPLQKVGNSWR